MTNKKKNKEEPLHIDMSFDDALKMIVSKAKKLDFKYPSELVYEFERKRLAARKGI